MSKIISRSGKTKKKLGVEKRVAKEDELKKLSWTEFKERCRKNDVKCGGPIKKETSMAELIEKEMMLSVIQEDAPYEQSTEEVEMEASDEEDDS